MVRIHQLISRLFAEPGGTQVAVIEHSAAAPTEHHDIEIRDSIEARQGAICLESILGIPAPEQASCNQSGFEPRAVQYFSIDVQHDPDSGLATAITWIRKTAIDDSLLGVNCPRSICLDWDEATFWSTYI